MSRGMFVGAAVAAVLLSGCGGGGSGIGPATHSVLINVNGYNGSRFVLGNSGSTVEIPFGINGAGIASFTGLAKGASYDIKVATQPTTPVQNCVVANGTGTVGDSDVTVSVTCTTTPARFLVTQDFGGPRAGCLRANSLDSTSGSVSDSGGTPACPPLQPTNPLSVSGPMALGAKQVYIAIPNGQLGVLAGFSLNHDSGTFTLSQTVSAQPGLMAIDPTGKYLFKASSELSGSSGSLVTSSIDKDSGALTFASALDFGATAAPFDVTADPLNRFVFVAYSDSTAANQDSVVALKLDANTGALTKTAAPVTVTASHGLVAHPSGKYLYVLDGSTNSIAAFSVDSNSGTLTPVAGSPFAVVSSGTAGEISAAAIDPTGRYLFVTDYKLDNIAAYGIDPQTGKLAAINGSPFATGHGPLRIVIEPQGHFLYVSNSAGLSAQSIDNANGALTPLAGSPFAAAFGGWIGFTY
jgi:6-phosphogluconolactonase (cycloisomerase 2 family)